MRVFSQYCCKIALVFFLLLFLNNPVVAKAAGNQEEKSRQASNLSRLLDVFLGIPFRADGALDHNGRWVTFNKQDTELSAPGFNCSGFTVAGASRLLRREIRLEEAIVDRLGDSGPDAKLGQDWDFGLDLILNLSQDLPRRFFPPIEMPFDSAPLEFLPNGRAVGLGVALSSPYFEEYLAELKPGRFAFFVFSKPDKRFPAGVSYYHVGLIVPEKNGDIWLYHSTAGAKTHRLNLAKTADLNRLRRYFPALKVGERRVLMIEVDLNSTG